MFGKVMSVGCYSTDNVIQRGEGRERGRGKERKRQEGRKGKWRRRRGRGWEEGRTMGSCPVARGINRSDCTVKQLSELQIKAQVKRWFLQSVLLCGNPCG